MRKEPKSKKEWIKFGNDVKDVHQSLNNLLETSDGFLSRKDTQYLYSAINKFLEFKSILDHEVILSGDFNCNDKELPRIFYGKKLKIKDI